MPPNPTLVMARIQGEGDTDSTAPRLRWKRSARVAPGTISIGRADDAVVVACGATSVVVEQKDPATGAVSLRIREGQLEIVVQPPSVEAPPDTHAPGPPPRRAPPQAAVATAFDLQALHSPGTIFRTRHTVGAAPTQERSKGDWNEATVVAPAEGLSDDELTRPLPNTQIPKKRRWRRLVLTLIATAAAVAVGAGFRARMVRRETHPISEAPAAAGDTPHRAPAAPTEAAAGEHAARVLNRAAAPAERALPGVTPKMGADALASASYAHALDVYQRLASSDDNPAYAEIVRQLRLRSQRP